MSVKLVKELKHSCRNQIDDLGVPFLSYNFLKTLEDSNSIGEGTGWSPVYFCDPGKSSLTTFIKEHSYGEYIFDWDWANFYHQYNIPYYPKLTSMVPFTSVTNPHFLGEPSEIVMESYEKYYNENNFSSSHFLFLTKKEVKFFESLGYIIRDSFQYHFINKPYSSFDDFLSDVKSKKAKQIRRERLLTDNIRISKYTGDDLTIEHAQEMYEFYLSTIENKQAISYLTKNFFISIFKRLKKNILYVQAAKEDKAIAGSLFFYDDERLYGRYWGAKENIANLHFELCFYQGIEFCIEKKFTVFEAGAQGEHKISRGFRPVKTYSAHKFKHPDFSNAIERYISDERVNIKKLMDDLSTRLPFREELRGQSRL